MGKRRLLNTYSVYDLILIAMMCALTIAFKSVARVLVSLITGPLGVPGGALAGGFYMMWMPLTLAIINKRGSALLMTLIQVIVVIIAGIPGSHGIMSFLTYLPPALAIEIIFLIGKNKGYNIIHFIVGAMAANIIGTIATNTLFFRLNAVILIFTLTAAAFSGSLGGILGYLIYKRVEKTGLIKKLNVNKEININQDEK